ncbi:MAG: hypothetical protein DRJ38_10100 [Thermoprotei archaeon]|nr:MAG: hypothetical protein DRJ38_10100 [Thermoprotei archaeon]
MSLITAEAAVYALTIIFLPLLLMVFLKIDIVKTSAVVLLFSILAAVKLGFLDELPWFIASGLWTGLQIASIVVAALLFYNVYRALGYEDKLKRSFGREYSEKMKLPLSVFFAGFIESTSGFGITVAVAAPMVAMLGTEALTALVACLIGHSWAVPYASLGIPTLVLSSLTSTDSFKLSQVTGILLSPSLFMTVLVVSRILKFSRRELLISLMLTVFLPIIAYLVGPLTGLIASLLIFLTYITVVLRKRVRNIIESLKPYIALTIVLILANLSGMKGLFSVSSCIVLLAIVYSLFNNRSVLIQVSKKTIKASYKPAMAIIFFTIVADISRQSGMMEALAEEVAGLAGGYFLYAIPIMGIIGTYITGSNTASNIIFAALYESYAKITGLDPYLVLALQNSGGGLGSMIAPSKIAVGASTLESEGLEGLALRETIKYIVPVAAPLMLIALVSTFT